MRRRAAVVLGLICGCRGAVSATPPPAPTEAPTEVPVRQAAPVATPAARPCPAPAVAIERGLTVERWQVGAACIDVVRADPARFRVRALLAGDDPPHTAPQWRDIFHLAAVTNAGMFHADNRPVGLIVVDGTPHGRDNAKMSGFVAWDPRSPTDAPIAIAGRDCDGFGDVDALAARYRTVVQSYRLLGCKGEALDWKDPKRYSAAAIGVARDGAVVLLHVRAGLTMAELSRGLAAHDLAGALFLEGGPEASLIARTAVEAVGSFETGFFERDDNRTFWKLPNVIGLEPR